MFIFLLVGRELFMTDTTLNDSDLKFLAAAGDTAITVDESLFEVINSHLGPNFLIWASSLNHLPPIKLLIFIPMTGFYEFELGLSILNRWFWTQLKFIKSGSWFPESLRTRYS